MPIHVVSLVVLLSATGCVGGGRTGGASHPASPSSASTPLPVVARAVTHEDDASPPASGGHAHHGHAGHAGHTVPSAEEHAHD